MIPFNQAKYESYQDRDSKLAYETEEIERVRKELWEDIKKAQILKRKKSGILYAFLEREETSYLYVIFSGKRYFSLPPYELVLFCYYIYGKTSCHEVLSGLKGVTMLPKRLSGVTEMFLALSKQQQREVINFMDQYLDDDLLSLLEEKPDSVSIDDLEDPWNWPRKRLYKVNHKKLVKMRLREAANDRAIRPFSIFGNPCKSRDRKAIELYFSEEEEFYSRYSTLLHFALQLNTSVDQFYVIDYTERTDVKLFGTNHIIEDKNAKEFIRRYLFIQYNSEDEENAVLEKVMSMYFSLI